MGLSAVSHAQRLRFFGYYSILCLVCVIGCEGDRSLSVDPPQIPLEAFEGSVRQHLEEIVLLLEENESASSSEETSRKHAQAAMVYHAYDLRESAIYHYRRSLEQQSDHRLSYLLAKVLMLEFLHEEAFEVIEPFSSLSPPHIVTLLCLSEIENTLQRDEESAQALATILSLKPDSVPALFQKGRLLHKNGEAQEACDVMRRALQLSPGASAIRYPYALALKEIGDIEEAARQMKLRGSAMPRPSDPWLQEVMALRRGGRVHLNEGTLLFEENLYERAEASFLKALEFDPESASVHLNLGSTLLKLGRPDEARESFIESIRLDPSQPLAWFDLGVLEASTGHETLAIECYDRALDLDPDQPESRFNRGNALRRQKKYQRAVQDFERVCALRPGNTSAWLAEAVCHIRLGNHEHALKRCRLGLLATDNNARLVSMEARLLGTLSTASPDELRGVLERLQKVLADSRNLEFVESRAMVLAALNRYPEAQQLQRDMIDAARQAGEEKIARRLLKNLENYSRGEPAVDPWPESDSSVDASPTGSAAGSAAGSVPR